MFVCIYLIAVCFLFVIIGLCVYTLFVVCFMFVFILFILGLHITSVCILLFTVLFVCLCVWLLASSMVTARAQGGCC